MDPNSVSINDNPDLALPAQKLEERNDLLKHDSPAVKLEEDNAAEPIEDDVESYYWKDYLDEQTSEKLKKQKKSNDIDQQEQSFRAFGLKLKDNSIIPLEKCKELESKNSLQQYVSYREKALEQVPDNRRIDQFKHVLDAPEVARPRKQNGIKPLGDDLYEAKINDNARLLGFSTQTTVVDKEMKGDKSASLILFTRYCDKPHIEKDRNSSEFETLRKIVADEKKRIENTPDGNKRSKKHS